MHPIFHWTITRWWQLKYSLFSPQIWGRWTHFDEHMFQMGWFNHQPDNYVRTYFEEFGAYTPAPANTGSLHVTPCPDRLAAPSRFSVRLATLWQPTQEALLQAGALKRSKEDEQNNGSNGANTTAPKRKNLGEIERPWWCGIGNTKVHTPIENGQVEPENSSRNIDPNPPIWVFFPGSPISPKHFVAGF